MDYTYFASKTTPQPFFITFMAADKGKGKKTENHYFHNPYANECVRRKPLCFNGCFCSTFGNYCDFCPLVQQSVSGSSFLSSLLLSNPRFTLTLHFCCLAESAVSSMPPPPRPPPPRPPSSLLTLHTHTRNATILQQPPFFLQSTFNTTIFSHNKTPGPSRFALDGMSLGDAGVLL